MGHDLRFALRRLRRRPLHSALVSLTLALGIGGSLAVFAIVDRVLLRPLPYPDPDRLVRISQTIPVPGGLEVAVSDVAYRQLGAGGRSLAALAAYTTRDANLRGRDGARRLIMAQVSASLFDVLRPGLVLGRGFTPDEDLPGGPRVVVLSDRLWRSAFNADSSVLGRVADLEGEPFTIVGVLAAEAVFPAREVAAWEPLRLDPAAINPYQNRYRVVGRLQAGAGLASARADLTEQLRVVGRLYPGPHPGSALDPAGYRANVRPLAEDVAGDVRPVVVLLLAGVLMLLLLTCANVANLQLAGVIARRGELAVRAALGATRGRLVRGALIEGVLLAGAGGVLGMGLAAVGAGLLASLLPPGIPAEGVLSGGRVLGAAVAVILLVGAGVGAVPVAALVRRGAGSALRDRAAVAGAGPASANRLRRLLAVAQVGLAVLLLHGAGLLLASARAVQAVRLGFEPESVLSLRINLPAATFRDRIARETLLRRLVGEASRLPGVRAAGLVNALPLEPGRQDIAMAVEGRPFKADGTDPLADYRVASAGYFATMGIALRRGRLFTDDDANARFTPLVISEGLARRLFPDGADPIGQRLRFGPGAPWMPIVGVVADARNRSLTESPRPELYLPGLGTWAGMAFQSEITLVVRAGGDPAVLAAPLRRLITAVAPDVAVYNLAPMEQIVHEARSRMTTVTRLMTGYAVVALLLAVAGIHAVLSYLVSQRRHELAVRLALGASPAAVVSLVAREGLLVAGAGLGLGLAGALAGARLLAGLLFGVGTLDPRVAALVVASVGVAAVAAGYLPAVRAARVDPGRALRAGG